LFRLPTTEALMLTSPRKDHDAIESPSTPPGRVKGFKTGVVQARSCRHIVCSHRPDDMQTGEVDLQPENLLYALLQKLERGPLRRNQAQTRLVAHGQAAWGDDEESPKQGLRGNDCDDGWQRHDQAEVAKLLLVPIIATRMTVQRAFCGLQEPEVPFRCISISFCLCCRGRWVFRWRVREERPRPV
jgi:hypothetical protein